MGWFFLEVAAALAIAVGIVWWTLPRKPGNSRGEEAAAEKKEDPPRG